MENQPPLWEAADNLFFNREQNAQIDKEGKRLKKIATSRPLPEDYEFKHEGAEGLLPDGRLNREPRSITQFKDTHAVHVITKPQQYDEGQGWSTHATVSWNTRTGKIAWTAGLGHLMPHVLNEANRWSAANGATPPLWSDDMTTASHRMASRHANLFIPPNAKVDEQSLQALNEHAVPFVHRVREHAARLHAETLQNISGGREEDSRIQSVNEDYGNLNVHLNRLHRALSEKNLRAIYGISETAEDSATNIGTNDIPDHLSRHWYDLGDQIASLREGNHSIDDLNEMMNYNYRR